MYFHAAASAANSWHYYPAHSMSKLTSGKKLSRKKHLQIGQWLKSYQEKN
jgi:hypothetical protein